MNAIGRDLDVPASAMAIAAHPDDVEFGCGGTLAKWAAAGCTIHHVICTDGSKGTWDPEEDIDALRSTRQVEQRAAAKALGASGEQVFLGWVDGELESGLAQRAEVARVIRTLQPQVVLGHDPWKRYRLHPDHRHAGFLAVEGIVGARDPFFFPDQGLAPHRPDVILLWEADVVDHIEDITSSFETKVAALLEHRSQFVTTHEISDPDDAEQVAGFRRGLADRHAEIGLSVGVRWGEAFKRL
ncbi:MAG: PIG-L deacetylase family protein [Acidimicrobiales bacterium]